MLQTFTIPSAPPVARLLEQKGSHSRPLTCKHINDPFEIPQNGVRTLNTNVRSTRSIAGARVKTSLQKVQSSSLEVTSIYRPTI